MSEAPETKIVSIADLTPDDRNANQGTERGNYALGHSIESHGLGRSILLDKDGRIIAGNKTHAKAGELGFDEVIVVQTDGKKLVAVQRTDISLDSPEGRGLAIADNRAGELGLEWNVDELLALHDEGLADLNKLWTQEEIDGLMGAFDESGEDSAEADSEAPDDDQPYENRYGVLIECDDVVHQEKVYNDLQDRGYQCRILTV